MREAHGTLHIVGTPIGNLGDITARAIETLGAVDLIACEDTRRTLGLLTHFGIKKPLVSYYKPKEREGAARILAALERGDDVALVTDAGMPCISDPGALVVREARARGYAVTSSPGATAVATALAVSGILEPVFVFIGFLPPKRKDAQALLKRVDAARGTIAIYASPHSINDDLALIFDSLGEREVTVVRELTKVYESVEDATLPFSIDDPRGEYVLLIHADDAPREDKPEGSLKEQVLALMDGGMDKKSAIKQVAKLNKVPKDSVYKQTIGGEDEDIADR